MKPVKRAAARELLMRRRARASLVDFARAIDIPGAPVSPDPEEAFFKPVETSLAAHHRLMLEAMENLARGKIKRLMLFLPPGSAKSTFGSVVFPCWLMGRQPGTKIILTSYGSDLAKKHGRKARQVCRDARYQSIFGTGLSAETSSADFWALDSDSAYMAGGILSGITGARAHGLIIDDPVKGREAADSETIRNKTWEAYQDDLRTRLIPGGWELIIQTRWHELDLAGQILPDDYDGQTGNIQCRDGRDWYVISLPAQCEKEPDPVGRKIGEYLWPQWFTPEHFEGFKAQPRTWSALFQQRPQPDEGSFFIRDWFKWFDPSNPPEHLHKYISTDFAVTEGKGDSTELAVLGVDPKDNIYILDWWSGQQTADVWIDELLALVARFQPFAVFGESGPIRRAIEPFLVRRMAEKAIYCRTEWLARTSDKATSARGIQARAAQGMLHLPDNQIGRDVLDQLLRFPAGRHDDKVDALALFGMALDMAHPAIAPAVKPKARTMTEKLWDRWTQPEHDVDREILGGGWGQYADDDYADGGLIPTMA